MTQEWDRAYAEAGIMPVGEYVEKWRGNMPDAEKDIVERLPEIKAWAECGIGYPPRGNKDLRAMLDTITTLRAEVERLTAKFDVNWELVAKTEEARANKAEAERDAAIARAEKAEAALWPFARIKMAPYSVMASDDASIELSGFELIDGKAFIKASAFRKARASLTEGETG